MLLLLALEHAPIVPLLSDYITLLFEGLSTVVPSMQLFETFQLRLLFPKQNENASIVRPQKHNFQQIK
jgi:hypothetical protein